MRKSRLDEVSTASKSAKRGICTSWT